MKKHVCLYWMWRAWDLSSASLQRGHWYWQPPLSELLLVCTSSLINEKYVEYMRSEQSEGIADVLLILTFLETSSIMVFIVSFISTSI